LGGIVRAAVVGGRRGRGYRRAFAALPDEVRLAAICDRDPAVLAEWAEAFPDVPRFGAFEELLAADVCDAVFLATPIQMHVSQALAALGAGKHVLSEVPAATTLEECWALVEAVERSGRTYMLAENYCYMRPNMLVRNMVQGDVFGPCTYAEGAYIHDTRNLLFAPDGALTWRGEIARDLNGNTYPTHSLGPVAQWLGTTGPEATDRLTELVCFVTPEASRWRYAAEHLGAAHPAAQPGYFKMGDSASVMLHTAAGAVVYIRRDAASPRPHNMTHYALQGQRASYLSPRFGGEDPLVWIEGRAAGEAHGSERWQSLWDYAAEYEHPRWRERGAVAREAGHGGGDYFIVEDFVRAVREGAAGSGPAVDVYDAVTWSSVFPLSAESVQRGGQPVAIPDFRRSKR
jgi:predicted dehydrogenase